MGTRLSPLVAAFTLLTVVGHVWPQERFEPLLTIGSLEGDSGPTFGRIVDTAMDSAGTVVVLDQLAVGHHLYAFSASGDPVASTGTKGRGPGEFVDPTAIAAFQGGRVYVLDNANSRMTEFHLTDNELVRIRSFRLPFHVTAVCRLEAHFIMLSFHRDRLLHVVDGDGTVRLSFGRPYFENSILSTVDQGELSCSNETGTVLLASMLLPELRLYSADGRLLWKTEIEGFSPIEISITPGGGRQFRRPDDSDPHAVVSSWHESPELVAVQFGFHEASFRALEDIQAVTTVFFSVADGSEVERRTSIPRVDWAASDILLAHPSLPFPRVLMYKNEISGARQ